MGGRGLVGVGRMAAERSQVGKAGRDGRMGVREKFGNLMGMAMAVVREMRAERRKTGEECIVARKLFG